jgi:asparagine synthase (glutamine-hydrolysing)
MCGIVGICGAVSGRDRQWLTVGRDALEHRGPDSAGEWWSSDGRVGLGHRRLAIIDLSSLGNQPMHLPARGLSIVFNGEIYNHKALRLELKDLGFVFRSNSDTEVLLAAYAAWGNNCLERINGMFAFAIYDEPQRKLLLVRDRAGEKPLFYYLKNGCLQFASELKALLKNPANPRRINTEALDCYLAMGYVPGNRCILQDYSKLPPAHALCFDLRCNTLQVWRYWQLPDLVETPEPLDEDAFLDELESTLEDAVRSQMVADVPVGILLSGGVDSSLIASMAVRASTQVKTFTIGFPGHGRLDETDHARLIARHFGTQHTELMAEDATADLLPQLAKQFDEPIVDSSMIPTFLVSQLVRQHCSVALGGDGGDELFGGYGHYSRIQWMQKNLGWLPLALRQGGAHLAEKYLPVGFKGRNWVRGLGVDLDKSLPLIATYFDLTTRRSLLNAYDNWPFIAEAILLNLVPNQPDLLQRSTRMDFANYLAEDILVKVDRASMMSSLEIRAPFLDRRLIEFAFGKVPTRLKATPTSKKILLKRLTNRVLPPEFDQTRKQGFSIPLDSWLKSGSFRILFKEVLLDPKCAFNAKTVSNLLIGQDKGRSNSERLFSLVLFELWRQEYAVTI